MAEIEIHHEQGHDQDPMGKRVGALAAVIAVFLTIVSIASHRTHTEAIIDKSSANDQWGYYQASRLKFHNLELGEGLTKLLGPKGEATTAAIEDYEAQKTKYAAQSKEIQEKARESDEKAVHAEHKALRYDLGEGLLEIGMVLTSLYFIARRMMFPTIGLIAAVGGLVLAVTGLLL